MFWNDQALEEESSQDVIYICNIVLNTFTIKHQIVMTQILYYMRGKTKNINSCKMSYC